MREASFAIVARNLRKLFPLETITLFWIWMGRARTGPSIEALKGISLTVPKGEMVGVLGRNGAGKSTLLRTLSGVYSADGGSVTIHGDVGALFELGGFGNRHLTGRAFVRTYLILFGVARRRRAALMEEIEEFAELGDYFDQKILSLFGRHGGAALFAATVIQHDVYLIDEVLSVGDEYFQAKSWSRLRERLIGGGAGVLVTHDWSAVIKLCRTARVLEDGAFVREGPADEVVRNYLNLPAPEPRGAEILEAEGFTARCGGLMRFEFEVALHADIEVEVSLSIEHLTLGTGWEIVLLNEYSPVGSARGRYRICVELDDAPLSPGDYLVNIFLASPPAPVTGQRETLHARSWTHGNGLKMKVTGEERPDLAPFAARWEQLASSSQRQIIARDLCKDYHLAGSRTKRVLDALDFTFSEGERIGIIGSNGAGKTTLLQIIAGLTDASSGSVCVDGHVTSIFSLGVGLRDDLTGRENIFIDGELQGHSRQTRRLIPEIIAFAELGEFIDRPVRTYSTGMKSRLAFSLLVHIDPDILVIDEALSVGDAGFSAKAQDKMRDLAARGRILLVVSHSMRAIRTMCTRCIWLDAGRIRMDGDPADVTEAYVESVKQMREEALKEQASKTCTAEALKPGFAIRSVQFLRGSGEKRAGDVLQSGEPAAVLAEIDALPGSECRARLQIDRLDGLKVSVSDSAQSLPMLVADDGGHIAVRADLGPLPLNLGLYRASLTLYCEDAPVARFGRSFEVVNPVPHRGGRAVLVTQMTITSSRI